MEKLIDFSEPILRLVLPILLKDQTTGKNIIWATDPPPNVDCGPMGEITIEQLDRIKLVPRVQKRLSEQKKRTKGKSFHPAVGGQKNGRPRRAGTEQRQLGAICT